MANITKVPSGYYYTDSSAHTNLGPGKSIPTPASGDHMDQTSSASLTNVKRLYDYCTSLTKNGRTYTNCFDLYYGSANPPATENYSNIDSIKSKPVVSLDGCGRSTLQSVTGLPASVRYVALGNCTNLASLCALPNTVYDFYIYNTRIANLAPIIANATSLKTLRAFQNTHLTNVGTIPSSVTDLKQAFYGCTSLAGEIVFNGTLSEYSQAFAYTTQNIVLLGTSPSLNALAGTATNGNVYVGYKARIDSLTSIRCNASGVAYDDGNYVKLSLAYTANTGNNVQMQAPSLTENGVTVSGVTWYSDSSMTQAVSFPATLQSSGNLYAKIATDETAKGFGVTLNTSYSSYSWSSATVFTTLTGTAFIIDISKDGKCIGIHTTAIDGETDYTVRLGTASMPVEINVNGTPLSLLPYPVGARFYGDNTLDPESLFGGEWEVDTALTTTINRWVRTA